MAEEKFKLPRSSYDELVKIIIAYSKPGKPSSNEVISQLTGINRTRISANNSFLIGTEIIEGDKGKITTAKGVAIARALEHMMKDEISLTWRQIVEENDFLNKMVQAINVRRGMEISHLENHIAYSAGEAKGKEVMTGAKAVIEILKLSGLVLGDGDKILPVTDNSSQTTSAPVKKDSDENYYSTDKPESIQESIHLKSQELEKSISLKIQLIIQATPNELDGLGEKIRNLLKSLSN